MIYYHGSRAFFSKFLTPDTGAKIRSGEENRIGFRDRVFLSLSREKACEYAGRGGYIYSVSTEEAEKYKDSLYRICREKKFKLGMKKSRFVSLDIYVSRPEKIKIISVDKLPTERQ